MDKGAEFQANVRTSLDSLHNYALLLARPPEDHEDLLQDSLIRGFRGFDSFDRALPFKAWMFGIIRNTYVDRYRRRKRRPPEEPLVDEQPSGSLDSPLYSIPLAPAVAAGLMAEPGLRQARGEPPPRLEDLHRPRLRVPALTSNGARVPIVVDVPHPMAPEHRITGLQARRQALIRVTLANTRGQRFEATHELRWG